MNNTIPFHSATHAPQITVDVNILTMLKQAASSLSKMASLLQNMEPKDILKNIQIQVFDN